MSYHALTNRKFLCYLFIFRPVIFKYLPLPRKFLERREVQVVTKERSNLHCVQTSSFLFVGMWRVSILQNETSRRFSGDVTSRPKGDPGLLPIFQDFFTLVKSHPCILATKTRDYHCMSFFPCTAREWNPLLESTVRALTTTALKITFILPNLPFTHPCILMTLP